MANRDKNQKLLEDIRNLLRTNTATTQEEIKERLEKIGFEINQSKISRMLRKLGAIKTTNDDNQVVYSLPREPAPPPTSSPLKNLVIDIQYNESLIVIATVPGSASLIARLIDHHLNKLELLGTIAGDDTIFVVPKSIKEIPSIAKTLNKFLMNTKSS